MAHTGPSSPEAGADSPSAQKNTAAPIPGTAVSGGTVFLLLGVALYQRVLKAIKSMADIHLWSLKSGLKHRLDSCVNLVAKNSKKGKIWKIRINL